MNMAKTEVHPVWAMAACLIAIGHLVSVGITDIYGGIYALEYLGVYIRLKQLIKFELHSNHVNNLSILDMS